MSKDVLDLYKMNPEIYDQYILTRIERNNFNIVFDKIKQRIKLNKNTKILDLCCGTGVFPRLYLKNLKNISYVGVDINKPFIEFARTKLNHKNFMFVVHNAVNFKSKDRFDIIIATSSYHHIQNKDKSKFLKNIKNKLNKNGVLIVYDKLIADYKNISKQMKTGIDFYGERICEMISSEKLNKLQLFSLFNEMYLTSVRVEEYKVSYDYFFKDLKKNGLKILEEVKTWPKKDVFDNKNVGDFVFVITLK